MSTTPAAVELRREQQFDTIADAIHEHGYIILPGTFAPDIATHLLNHLQGLARADFKRAGVGRDLDHHINSFIRKDEVCWLEPHEPALAEYFAWTEALRLHLNRRLFLGLFDYECHYAAYPPGAFYKKHLDAFKGNTNRRLTTVLYLNPDWSAKDGGELLLYDDERIAPLETVMPTFGTLVMFLSERFPHEVLPARRQRFSLAGWYRINGDGLKSAI